MISFYLFLLVLYFIHTYCRQLLVHCSIEISSALPVPPSRSMGISVVYFLVLVLSTFIWAAVLRFQITKAWGLDMSTCMSTCQADV